MTTERDAADDDRSVRSVFIVEPQNHGWIIERLMRDLAEALKRRGLAVQIGPATLYAGEDAIFNSRYLQPFKDPRAKVRAVFITHVDDHIREIELRRTFGQFNSFVCLSKHDAEFVAALKGDGSGVIGLDLPPRDLTVRPIRLGMFSARYADGRKNERWITDYFQERPADHRTSFTFCFFGEDWEEYCAKMAKLDLNFEICRYSRQLPGEYQLYKERLPSLDFLIYLGFDGGAMSAYDAVNAGIDLLATNISYHRDLDEGALLMDNRDDFFAAMDRLHAKVAGRRAALASRSIETYSDRLLGHWESLVARDGESDRNIEKPSPDTATVSEFRSRYKPLSYSRLRSALIRFLYIVRGT